jgi:hypothetical protein
MFMGLQDPDPLVRGTDPDPSLFRIMLAKYGRILTQNFLAKN